MAPRSITLEGRTLEPERIILGKRTITTNPQCDWTRDLFNDILVAVKINNWLLVCTDKDNSKAQDFSKCLIEVAQKMGIKINSPKMISLNNDRTDTYVTRIRDEINPAVSYPLFLDRVLFYSLYTLTLFISRFSVGTGGGHFSYFAG